MNPNRASFARLTEWIRGSKIGPLVLASVALGLIYSNPPLKLRQAPPDQNSPGRRVKTFTSELLQQTLPELPSALGQLGVDTSKLLFQAPPDLSSALASQKNASKLLLDEHKKVVDEIQVRIEEENELFRYKFALMGGLFLAFLAHIAFPLKKEDRSQGNTDTPEKPTNGKSKSITDGPEERIAKLIKSSATFLVLALAVTIAVTIDLHMRTGVIATNQLALWIKDYVEPAFLQKPLVGYETYLRLPGAMESGKYYAFLYWVPEHLISWLIYVAYLIVLQNVYEKRTQRRMQILLGFVLVHVSLGAFAWMGHAAPSAYQFVVFGLPVDGLLCPFLFLVPCLVLAYVNWCYVGPLVRMKQTGA